MSPTQTKIAFWIATVLVALPVLGSGLAALAGVDDVMQNYARLGYPAYFATIIGVWKVLGVAALVIRKFPMLTQAAYAGFTFTLSGAAISHIAAGDPTSTAVPPLVFLGILAASYALRPGKQRGTSAGAATGFVDAQAAGA